MMFTKTALHSVHDAYVQYAPQVYRMARLFTRNHADAEDIVQEVFFRALKNWQQFRGDALVKGWIMRIARNYLIDIARKAQREQNLRQNIYPIHTATLLDTRVEIEDMLDGLPDSQKRAVYLRLIKDLSVADSARVLGCSQAKIRTDTHRAIMRLKKLASG